MDPTLQQPTADDDKSQRNFDFMAEIRAIQASRRESEASIQASLQASIQASMRESEERILKILRESEEQILTTFKELIDKHALKIKLLAEAKKRKADRVEKRKLAKSEQCSRRQQRLLKERQAESDARACIECECEAEAMIANVDDDAPEELQQGSDASMATLPSDINETEEDACITFDFMPFTSILQLTEPSSDIIGNFHCVLELQRLESFECVFKTLSSLSLFVDDERESADAVQCRPAGATIKTPFNAKAFAVVSSSTVWDPGGLPSCCCSTGSDVERANVTEESETPALSCLPRQQAFRLHIRLRSGLEGRFQRGKEVRHTVSYFDHCRAITSCIE